MTTAHESVAAAWAAQRAREPIEVWQALILGAPVVTLPAASPVHAEGLLDDGAAAVLDGVVRLYTVSPYGRQLTMRYGRFGDLVGLTGPEGLRPVGLRAEAVTALTVAVLPTAALREAALGDARFGWSLAQEI